MPQTRSFGRKAVTAAAVGVGAIGAVIVGVVLTRPAAVEQTSAATAIPAAVEPAAAESAAPVASSAPPGETVQATAFDRPIGDPDAPITIIEYASFTCVHCGTFHNEIWPDLKAQYVDTGQVYFLFRDFPLNGLALSASLLTHCVPEDAYHGTVTELFRSQEEWMGSEDPMSRLLAIGVFAGASEAELEACMADRSLAENIIAVRLEGEAAYEVSGTPTFVINGETITGARPIEAFTEIIERLLPDLAG